MQSNPLVSIIIPVYNVAQYLDQCLQSVMDQSYTDWECILVDDGSKDGSGVQCDEWSKRDSRFRVIHQQNQGVSAARNKGLDVSQGAWICFIDSDDWVRPNYIQHLVESIDDEVDYIVSGCQTVVEGCVSTKTIPNRKVRFELDNSCEIPFTDLFRKHLINGPCHKLYRHSILSQHNIRFPELIAYGEDLLFNYEYLKYVNKIATVPQSDYYYRQLIGISLSHKPRPDRFANEYDQWKVRCCFLESKKLWFSQVQSEMFKILWGIVYDGLFESSANRTFSYIRNILSIPEISELAKYAEDFAAARWIKWLILHQQAWVFWLMFKK